MVRKPLCRARARSRDSRTITAICSPLGRSRTARLASPGARRWMAKTSDARSTRRTHVTDLIVSYDDTPSDRDALMLARILGVAGAQPILVYVRHQRPPSEPARNWRNTRPGTCSNAAPAGSAVSATATRRVSSSARRPPTACAGSPRSEHADLVIFGSDTAPPRATSRPSARPRPCLTAVRRRSRSHRPAIGRIACRGSHDRLPELIR